MKNWREEYSKIWVDILNRGGNHIYYYQLKGIIKGLEQFISKVEKAAEERALKRLKGTIKQKFPRGEREWCVKCARRIYKSLVRKEEG